MGRPCVVTRTCVAIKKRPTPSGPAFNHSRLADELARRLFATQELVHHRHSILDRLNHLPYVERLAEEAVEAAAEQALGLFVRHLAAHGDDLGELQIGVAL